MKTLLTTLMICLLFSANITTAQQSVLPSITLQTTEYSTINSNTLLDGQDVIILIFWKAGDKKCCCHISSMIEAKNQMLAHHNVRIVGICSGEGGTTANIKPFIAGKDWDMEVYIDTNDDLKRAMGIPNTPFTIVYGMEDEVVCQYNGHCVGSEELICERLQNLLAFN